MQTKQLFLKLAFRQHRQASADADGASDPCLEAFSIVL
jgi:hypothetical protein